MFNEQFLANRPPPGAQINFNHPLAKDLVACWLLNDQGSLKAFDLSPYKNHLTLTGFGSPLPTRQNGMPFAGAQYLSKSIPGFRSADSQGAIEVWFRSSSTANNQTLFASSDTASATKYLALRIRSTDGFLAVNQRNADTEDNVRGSTNVCDGKWHHVVLSSSDTAYVILLDGIPESLVVLTGTNSGDWFADTAARDNISSGARVQVTIVFFSINEQGFTRIYSRPKSLTEARELYLKPYDMFLKGD
jgi:hypothetical protein